MDFVEPSLAHWNTEMLSMSGLLARILYEQEMLEIKQMYESITLKGDSFNVEAITYLEKRAIHAMQSFAFKPTTPYGRIGALLSKAFFDASSYAPLLITTKGVFLASEVRLPNKEITFIRTIPLVKDSVLKDCDSFFRKLQEYLTIPLVDIDSVISELDHRSLEENEITELLKWWVRIKMSGRSNIDMMKRVFSRLKLGSGSNLWAVTHFLNPGIVPPSLPLANSVISYNISRNFNKKELEAYFKYALLLC